MKKKGGSKPPLATPLVPTPVTGSKKPVTPSEMGQLESGMCHYHWTYGEKATKCKGICSWQGN